MKKLVSFAYGFGEKVEGQKVLTEKKFNEFCQEWTGRKPVNYYAEHGENWVEGDYILQTQAYEARNDYFAESKIINIKTKEVRVDATLPFSRKDSELRLFSLDKSRNSGWDSAVKWTEKEEKLFKKDPEDFWNLSI